MANDKLSPRTRRVKTIIGWAVFILLVVTQWEVRPWPLFSLSFFGLFLIWQAMDSYHNPRLWQGIVLIGAGLNGLALFANGGRMPVLGRTEVSRWWEPLTNESHLAFLCDIYFKCSVGDMVVATGALVGLIGWLVQRRAVKRHNTDLVNLERTV